jgi:hypothetical protein
MSAKQPVYVKCRSCGGKSAVRCADNNERVQFVCDRCGYMANFSVGHIRTSHGARASTRDEQRTS